MPSPLRVMRDLATALAERLDGSASARPERLRAELAARGIDFDALPPVLQRGLMREIQDVHKVETVAETFERDVLSVRTRAQTDRARFRLLADLYRERRRPY